jgi:hypothetical protein
VFFGIGYGVYIPACVLFALVMPAEAAGSPLGGVCAVALGLFLASAMFWIDLGRSRRALVRVMEGP